MAFTVADVLADVTTHLNGFYPANDPRALVLANKAHSRIVQLCELYEEASWAFPFVAGQGVYTFNASVFRLLSADVRTGPDHQGYHLRESSIDKLDHTRPGWRNARPSSRPVFYYRSGSSVGIYPPPVASASLASPIAGDPPFPYVVVSGKIFVPLTTFDQALSGLLPNMDPYTYEIAARWCVQHQPDAAEFYGKLAKEAQDELRNTIQNQLIREAPRVVPNVPRIPRG